MFKKLKVVFDKGLFMLGGGDGGSGGGLCFCRFVGGGSGGDLSVWMLTCLVWLVHIVCRIHF